MVNLPVEKFLPPPFYRAPSIRSQERLVIDLMRSCRHKNATDNVCVDCGLCEAPERIVDRLQGRDDVLVRRRKGFWRIDIREDGEWLHWPHSGRELPPILITRAALDAIIHRRPHDHPLYWNKG